MNETRRIPVRDLTQEQRGQLAALLVLAGQTVRPVKARQTPKGPLLPYLEYWDQRKETTS